MPDRCDICGVAALGSESFQQETLPFRRTRRYCPACRQRLYSRIYVGIGLGVVVVGAMGAITALRRNAGLLDSVTVQMSLLFLFQWLMILPHELGHAMAARALGFQHIRILVGSGKPVTSFQLLGIPVLINLIPIGGITLFQRPNPLSRLHHLLFVISGPLVNLAAAGLALVLAPHRQVFTTHANNLFILLFWANMIVLVGNLFPSRTQTSMGPLNNDGLQLWHLLFPRAAVPPMEPRSKPGWVRVFWHLIKWAAFSLMLLAVLLLTLIGIFALLDRTMTNSWQSKIFLAGVMFSIALVAGWAAVRIAKHPVGSFDAHLGIAERMVRKGLEIVPGLPTLKGTLGGILVDQGRLAEAEPLLVECSEGSVALHDQGISSFYLGLIKLSRGTRKDARRLLSRAMVLYSEPWLVKRAKAKLNELNEAAGPTPLE